jgi:hypothetical protein
MGRGQKSGNAKRGRDERLMNARRALAEPDRGIEVFAAGFPDTADLANRET